MLVRTYRLTDKFGLALMKASCAFTTSTLDGINLVSGTARWGVGQVIGLILAFVLGVLTLAYVFLRRVLGILWRAVKFILGIIGTIGLFLLGLLLRSTGWTVRVAATGASGSAAGAMARRAARAEMQAGLTEDPLRVQNRVLSGLVVVALVALIGVMLWATNPARTSAPPAFVEGNFNFPNATPLATTVGEVAFATPVPTATEIPEVLQAQGSVAYVVREKAQLDIWAVAVGSRTPIRLTNSPQDDRDPAWSPDGRQLAYASRQDGNWDIYIYNLDTNQTSRMTFGLEFEAGPQWSPDGKWLVYESYRGQNLDIYLVPVDGSQPPQALPGNSPAPDFSPAWSAGDGRSIDGRHIAFVSWRDGNQDIYVFSLDTGEIANLTNTPNRHEDYPAWSPDGNWLAYSAVDEGVEKVFAKRADEPNAPAVVIALGRTPAWSPDGSGLIFAVDSLESTQLVAAAAPDREGSVAVGVIPVSLGATKPVWTGVPLPAALVNSGGLPLGVTEDLYIEQENPSEGEPHFRLDGMVNVQVDQPYLSERVNDSFNALRRAALEQSGTDFLGKLSDAFWDINRPPGLGEEPRTWYKTGRAFGFIRESIRGFPPPIEVVREERGLYTWWRVYVYVADEAQNGQLGEPLRRMPWDFLSRTSGDVTAYEQGGRLRIEMPQGYYVDLTQVAADYGWQRVPAASDWRANNNTINYWAFLKTDSLDWLAAMRELYTEGQLINFAPTPPITSGG